MSTVQNTIFFVASGDLRLSGSPVRKASYSQKAFGRFSWLKAQYEMMKRINWLPRQPELGMVLGPLTEAIYQAFTGKLDAEKSLKNAERTIKALLAGYQL